MSGPKSIFPKMTAYYLDKLKSYLQLSFSFYFTNMQVACNNIIFSWSLYILRKISLCYFTTFLPLKSLLAIIITIPKINMADIKI